MKRTRSFGSLFPVRKMVKYEEKPKNKLSLNMLDVQTVVFFKLLYRVQDLKQYLLHLKMRKRNIQMDQNNI